LGGKALGPVAWSEIEELLEDTFDAEDLLVARAGDEGWRPAAEVIEEFEEEEPDDESDEDEAPEPLEPEEGLGAWLGQAWTIVSERLSRFVSAGILLICISAFSLLICFPALHAGLYLMALKRFRGEKVNAGDITRGFHHFGRAFGLYVTIFIIGLAGGFITLVGMVIVMIATGASADADALGTVSAWFFWLAVSIAMAVPAAAAFFAVPLILDRDIGVVEALRQSWAVTRRAYLSYLGMTVVLSLLSALGGVLCWVGVVITLPLLPAAQVCAYMHYFPDEA
jgi:hypothetical protein